MNLPETICYSTKVCVSGAGFVWDNKAGLLHKTSNAMSLLSSVEARPICVRGRGEKKARSQSVCEETSGSQIGSWLWGFQDVAWDPGFTTGTRDIKAKLEWLSGDWSILCNGCGIGRKSPLEYWGDWGKICVRTTAFIWRSLLGTLIVHEIATQKAIPQFYCSYVEHRENKSAQRQPNKISGFLQNDKSTVLSSLHLRWSESCSTVHHSWFKSNEVVSKSPESSGRKLAPDKYYTDQKVTRLTQIYTYILWSFLGCSWHIVPKIGYVSRPHWEIFTRNFM